MQTLCCITDKQEAAMLQIDPWEKAAECERALQAAADPADREIFADVRQLWIGLANARCLLSGVELEEQLEAINQVHGELIKPATIRTL
jgi:hypothetical protein